MSTLTIPRDRIVDDIQAGDTIVAIDGRETRRPLVVAGYDRVTIGANHAVLLHNPIGTNTDWWLYPDSQVEVEITVRRQGDLAADALAEMYDAQEGVLEGPGTAPDAPETPAQPRPKARRTRRFGGLLLVSQGGGDWQTEDYLHGVTHQRAGITTCDDPHPVRISAEMAENARERPHHRWARPVVEALNKGKRGYWCPGGMEHEGEWGWVPWSDNASVDARAHAVYGTLAEAADSLAKALQEVEGGTR